MTTVQCNPPHMFGHIIQGSPKFTPYAVHMLALTRFTKDRVRGTRLVSRSRMAMTMDRLGEMKPAHGDG